MCTFRLKNLFLVSLLLMILLAACATREVVSSVESSSSSAASVSSAVASESVASSSAESTVSSSESVAAPSSSAAVSSQEPVVSSSSEAVVSEPTAGVTISTEVQRLAFREEIVTDIYAFETDTYTTVQCQSDFPDAEELLRLLEAMPEDTPRTSETERAFIVFTESGRYYIYLDKDETPEELWNIWDNVVSAENRGRHIQWLTHMTPEKITEIRAGGLGKTLTEREDIEAAAEFLKKEVFVGQIEKISVSEGENNPNMLGGLYHIVITFDTGVTYSMIGYGDVDGHIDEGGSSLSVWTSDLDRTVYYTLTEGCAGEIRKFFGQWK